MTGLRLRERGAVRDEQKEYDEDERLRQAVLHHNLPGRERACGETGDRSSPSELYRPKLEQYPTPFASR